MADNNYDVKYEIVNGKLVTRYVQKANLRLNVLPPLDHHFERQKSNLRLNLLPPLDHHFERQKSNLRLNLLPPLDHHFERQ
ncbi:unnamed protein product, partial [marine sediment metagenome]